MKRVSKEQKANIERMRTEIGNIDYGKAGSQAREIVYKAFCDLRDLEANITTEPTPEEKSAEKTKAEYAAIQTEREKLPGYVPQGYTTGATYTDQIVLAAVRVAKRELRAEIIAACTSTGYGSLETLAFKLEANGRAQ